MEKINVAELLKDCPKGMELDCLLFNNPVMLDEVADIDEYPCPITVITADGDIETFTKYGQHLNRKDAKCIIFPKGKTTWEGFHRPFKKGDIIYTKDKLGTEFVSIFQIEYERDICTYWDMNLSTNKLIGSLHDGNAFKIFIEKDKVKEQRLATEEEKQKLFDAIQEKGYKWNAETKTLENLEVKKFDINTLVPFDKVLVRDSDKDMWCASIFSHTCKDKYFCVGTWHNQCIPYEANKELLGTTNNPEEYGSR